MEHFDTFTRREIDDIRRQLEILEPWFQVSDEETELKELEGKFEILRVNLGRCLLKQSKAK